MTTQVGPECGVFATSRGYGDGQADISSLCERWIRIKQLRTHSEPRRNIEAVVQYMAGNLDKPLNVPALAKQTGWSVSVFHRRFKKATGSTPMAYFIFLRMQLATELLTRTTSTVKDIGISLGYRDSYYFSRLFKAAKGLSPSGYRAFVGAVSPHPGRQPSLTSVSTTP